MAKVDTGDELEHIDLDPAAPATVQHRRWPRRRVVVLLTTVALVGVMLGPVRTSALKGGFRHLERIFLESQAVSRARGDAYAAVFRRAVYDQARLTAAAARLYDAEEARHAELRRQLDDDIRVRFDSGLRRLRDALDPVIRRDPPFSELERARQLLTEARRRLGLRPRQAPVVSLMGAVAGDMRALSRYFDAATGTQLVAGTDRGLFSITIDTSRTRPLRPAGLELDRARGLSLYQRAGWVLAESPNGPWSYALGPDFEQAVSLGPGATYLSARADAVWRTNDFDWTERTEVDGTGRVLRGPLRITQATFQLTQATDAGLVLQDTDRDGSFRVWDPDTRRTVARHAGVPIAALGDAILRVEYTRDGDAFDASVIEARSGRVIVRVPVGDGIVGASFSPDGSRLAVTGENTVRLIHLETGGVRQVPSVFAQGTTTLAWSPSSRYVFFAGGSTITAWAVDGGEPTLLRLGADLASNITGLVALPA